MKFSSHCIRVLFISLILFSCKNDTTKNTEKETKVPLEESVVKEAVAKDTIKTATTTILRTNSAKTPLENNPEENLLVNTMNHPDLKTFVRVMLTANLIDLLSKKNAGYTLLAPNNDAFDVIPEDKMKTLFRLSNKASLVETMKNHILKGNFSTSFFKESIRKNGGTFRVKTLSGNYLTLSLDGEVLVVEDENGKKGLIKKAGMKSSNGVIYLLDVLLKAD